MSSDFRVSNNLPPRPEFFVDREHEIQQATYALLQGQTTVVGLIGMAGIGKTWLALEIAHCLLERDEFKGGMIWLASRDLQSSDDVLSKIGTVLEVPISEVYPRLSSQRCLIVLDGLDENPPYLPEMERFLETLPPHSKALITSRHEVSLPPQARVFYIAPFTEQAVTELFTALSARHSEMSDEDRLRISEIARALGYHPLALTLAARLVQGDYAKTQTIIRQALDVAKTPMAEQQRAAIFHTLASLSQAQGNYSEALQLYQESLEIAERLGDQQSIASTLSNLGAIAQAQGNLAKARRLYQQSLRIVQRLGDREGVARLLHNLGTLAQDHGEYVKARRLYQESLAIKERLEDRQGIAATLHQLGTLAQTTYDYSEARRLFEQALAIAYEIGDRNSESRSVGNLGNVYAAVGDIHTAIDYYQQALAIARDIGDRHSESTRLANLGTAYATLGEARKAIEYYEQAIAIARQIGDKHSLSSISFKLGTIYVEQGRWYDGLRLLEESLAILRQGDDINARADTIYQIARTNHLMGNLDEARIRYRDALRLYDRTDNQRGVAACKTGLGRLTIQTGWLDDAVHELEQAKQIYTELKDEQHVGEIEEVLHLANRIKERQPV